jgi:hypothetical protein
MERMFMWKAVAYGRSHTANQKLKEVQKAKPQVANAANSSIRWQIATRYLNISESRNSRMRRRSN